MYLLLGLIYREAGKPMEALRAFERASELDMRSAQAQFLLGSQLERLNRPAEARAALQSAIDLDPHHADALNYLGYMDIDQGVNLHEARRLIERALAEEPENGAYLDSLGWAHYRLGQLEDALRYLEQAARHTEDPTILEHLGDVYFSQRQWEKARDAWRKALELDNSLDVIQQKLRALPALPLLTSPAR